MSSEPIVEKYSQKEEINYYSDPEYLSGGLYTAELDLINRYFKPSGSVLDIGCGGGREAFALAKLGFAVTGIDITPNMLSKAEAASKNCNITNVTLKLGDVRSLEFEAETFDSAIMVSRLIQHIPTRKSRIQALKEINRVLKDNGVLIITSGKFFQGFFYLIWRAFTKAVGKAPNMKASKFYNFSSYRNYGNKSKTKLYSNLLYLAYLTYYYLRNNLRYNLMPNLTSVKRRAEMAILRGKYRGLELGDDHFDYANPFNKSQGKLFAHHYSCKEMEEDLKSSNFSLLEHKAAIELEFNIRLSNSVRKSAPLHYYVARKL